MCRGTTHGTREERLFDSEVEKEVDDVDEFAWDKKQSKNRGSVTVNPDPTYRWLSK